MWMTIEGKQAAGAAAAAAEKDTITINEHEYTCIYFFLACTFCESLQLCRAPTTTSSFGTFNQFRFWRRKNHPCRRLFDGVWPLVGVSFYIANAFSQSLSLWLLYDLKALSSLYTATTETTPASMDLYMALSVYGGGQKETFVWSKVHSIKCGVTWPKRIKTEKGWFMHRIFYSLMKGWREIEENL